MENQEIDYQVRLAAFRWLEEKVAAKGDVLGYRELLGGFLFKGQRVPLASPQGIFKPKILPELPLTIRTGSTGRYDDTFGGDGLLKYRYQGKEPSRRDNVGLRRSMELGVPLIYLHAVAEGLYLVTWPVFVVGDDPAGLTFTVAVDDVDTALHQSDRWYESTVSDRASDSRRAYITSSTRHRLHQRSFRFRVLRAYGQSCSLCRLRHLELLDAAHIIEDCDPFGEPVVQNGLALCKLHHAAFDRFIIGITPDYTVRVRLDILEEVDGPMLEHGLQEIHGGRISLPRSRDLHPDKDRLAIRYEKFRKAG